jgi:hypothetical protein
MSFTLTWLIGITYKASHHRIKRALVEFLHGGPVLVDIFHGRDEPPNPAWDMFN